MSMLLLSSVGETDFEGWILPTFLCALSLPEKLDSSVIQTNTFGSAHQRRGSSEALQSSCSRGRNTSKGCKEPARAVGLLLPDICFSGWYFYHKIICILMKPKLMIHLGLAYKGQKEDCTLALNVYFVCWAIILFHTNNFQSIPRGFSCKGLVQVLLKPEKSLPFLQIDSIHRLCAVTEFKWAPMVVFNYEINRENSHEIHSLLLLCFNRGALFFKKG